MKKVDEYTLEELMELLDDKETDWETILIEVEIAHRGLIPVKNPKIEEEEEIKVDKEVVGWRVGSIIFDNEEDALTLSKMNVFTEEYDYSIGYDYKYLKEASTVVTKEFFYKYEDLIAESQRLKEFKNKKEENEIKLKAFKDYQNKIYDARMCVFGFLDEARKLKDRIKTAQEVFDKYLVLAGNNLSTASQFFMNTYKDEEDILANFDHKLAKLEKGAGTAIKA